MAGIPVFETPVLPEWIDYNGHLRDAYYALIVSLATDALMDRVGLDAAYRARTGCTLYTVEMHLHFLQEVKQTDTVEVGVRILGVDRKRIHAVFEMRRVGDPAVAASTEVMLLHVRQASDKVATAAFPPEVSRRSLSCRRRAPRCRPGPGSRRMELRPHSATP